MKQTFDRKQTHSDGDVCLVQDDDLVFASFKQIPHAPQAGFGQSEVFFSRPVVDEASPTELVHRNQVVKPPERLDLRCTAGP